MLPRLSPLFAFLSIVFLTLAVFNFVCTKWGMRIAWAVIFLCLSYLSVKP
jgi:hypothetical protein